jgi:hypothetical protein
MGFDAIAKARELWETTTATQAEIGKAVGRSAATISRWAKTYNWKARPGAEGKPPREPNFSRKRANLAIAKGMHKVIMRNLDDMEKGLEVGTLAPADAERKSKTIASMIGGYGKVTETPHAEKKRKRGKADAEIKAVDEVERLQREIIERFERIERRREAARGSE